MPVVYTGRVTSPEVAARVISDGHADVVGVARALVADPDFVVKARTLGAAVRPCVGGNECISRRLVDNLGFSCTANPAAGREAQPLPEPVLRRRVLVVGGGPAGTEVARVAADRGHEVTLWEAADELGGQMAVAALAPVHDDFRAWLDWQAAEIVRLGVSVETGRRASVEDVLAFGADEVVTATGATPRVPDLPGVDRPEVHLSTEVLLGRAGDLGEHVLVVAADDHMAPLSVADHLASTGHRVTLVHGSAGPAPGVSRYILGSILARLDAQGVELRGSRTLAEVDDGRVVLRHVHSQRRTVLTDVDSVVLSCSAVPRADLHAGLLAAGVRAHLVGDAFAPRTMTAATRQAYDLARTF